MTAFLLRRIALVIPTLLGVAVITFVLLRVVPGDPIAMMIPPGASDADIAHLRTLYGLDKSIPEQFVIWAGQLFHGDLGTSISLRQDVIALVLERLPTTLELAFLAGVIAVLLGFALATCGIYWQNRWPDWGSEGISGLMLAIPDFLWGLMAVLLLGVFWPILPISGRIDPAVDIPFASQFYLLESVATGHFTITLELLRHMIAPALALAFPFAGAIARLLKSALGDVMREDYIMLAHVRGFHRATVIRREAVPNALIPTLTLAGVQFTFLLGGTVLVERIFSYPGIGNMAIGAVIARDLPLLQGLILTFAVMFIAINLLIDVTYGYLDPRLRHG